VRHPGFHGTPPDFVENPNPFNELWALTPAVFDMFSQP
jgi:Zn-dependent oligopeptidase